MRYFERTLGQSRALRQFAGLFARDVVALALAFVARFAEVRVAPAEPLGDRATEFALELYKVGAMLVTTCVAKTKLLRGALSADELLWLELLLSCLRRDAVLHTAEVGCLALETLVVSELKESPRLQIVVVVVVGVLKARVFVDTFVFGAFY